MMKFHGQYSGEVPVEYLRAEWKKARHYKAPLSYYMKRLKHLPTLTSISKHRVFESEEVDPEILLEELKVRLSKFHKAFIHKNLCDFYLLEFCIDKGKVDQYLYFDVSSTNQLFYAANDIPMLLNLAGRELGGIKAYNSRRLALYQLDEALRSKFDNDFLLRLDNVVLQMMGEHYVRIYKGFRSLNLRIDILRYHHQRRRDDEHDDLNENLKSLEGELRQYEEELKTTRSKVSELLKIVKKKTKNYFILSALLKTCLLGLRKMGLMTI